MPMDIYCERLSADFWAEPLNAISNISYFIAAWLAWRLARNKKCAGSIDALVLITLIAIIGVGSFLFHTLALRWTMYADIIPIYVFQSLFLIFYTQRVARFHPLAVALCFALFVVVSNQISTMSVPWLNGSLSYAPTLLFLIGTGIYHLWSQKHESWTLLLAGMIFTLSLTFRTIDIAVCDQVSIGTHSIWHMLTGVVLYLTVRAYLANICSGNATQKTISYD